MFLSSRAREKTRLALTLIALGLVPAVAGPGVTEAKQDEAAPSARHEAPPPPLVPQEPVELAKPHAPKLTAPKVTQPPPKPAAPKPTNLPQEPVEPAKPKTPKRVKRPTGNPQNTPTPQPPAPRPPESSAQASAPAQAQAPAGSSPEPQARSPRRGGGGGANTQGSAGGQGGDPPAGSNDTGPADDASAAEAAALAAESSPDTPGLDAPADEGAEPAPEEDSEGGSPVTRTVERIVEVVPESVGIALAGLAVLSLVLAGASLLSTARARRLARQRGELLQEVGLLQTALLPPVPERIGSLQTSVAYRPAEGPGAGGDFYDALPLPGGRAAFILGDVSGHGRAALERTAFLRYTLRAYLEAGLEPRIALQVGGRVIDERLDGDFATVVLAIHDPATSSLTFACAGHPAPIVVGSSAFEPVLPGSSPPLGIGLRTGLRQTTIPLAPGSVVCLFTDGLTEARTQRGILGRPRLGDIVGELDRDASATDLLEHVAAEARLVTDDMAAVLLSPTDEATVGGFRSEQLELSAGELGGNVTRRFLEACDVSGEDAALAELEAAEVARRYGGAVLNVSFGTGEPDVEVLPRNVESIEASSRKSIPAR